MYSASKWIFLDLWCFINVLLIIINFLHPEQRTWIPSLVSLSLSNPLNCSSLNPTFYKDVNKNRHIMIPLQISNFIKDNSFYVYLFQSPFLASFSLLCSEFSFSFAEAVQRWLPTTHWVGVAQGLFNLQVHLYQFRFILQNWKIEHNQLWWNWKTTRHFMAKCRCNSLQMVECEWKCLLLQSCLLGPRIGHFEFGRINDRRRLVKHPINVN